MKSHALGLAHLGWRVHPVHGIQDDGVCTCELRVLCRSAGKHPTLPNWVEAASADPDTVKAWAWDGLNLGTVPQGFCILDFDGAEGVALLERMSAILSKLPDDTPMARTGSGGYHLFIAGEAKTRTKIIPGLDIRGIGGQAVLPPSKHFSGNLYEWLNEPKGKPPAAPEWLAVAQGQVPDALKPSEVVRDEDLTNRIRGRWGAAVKLLVAGEPFSPVGQRNSTMASLAGAIALRWPHADPVQVGGLFKTSLDAMAEEADGAPTMTLLVSMLQRFQEARRVELTTRPVIYINTDIEGMALEGIGALAQRSLEMGIFSRGGLLTRVKPSEHLPTGILRNEVPNAFEPIAYPNLMAHLASVAQWTASNKDGEKSKYPPALVVQRIDKRGEWPGIPHAELLTEGMVLRPDGTVFEGGGYDQQTGTISVGLPDHTPLVSVDEGLALLRFLVSDFPFEDQAHFAAWLASVLTAVGQQVFKGPSPLFFVDANVAGAGKTMLAELAILIATGRSPARGTLGRHNEEDRKQITALAIAGAQCILVDNVKGLFGTAKLCEALSSHSSSWSDRILGKSETWSGPFKPSWFASGNNVRLRPDIARRTCYIRLNSPLEQPELRRGFQVPSLMAWASEHRAALYRAAVSVLHHYIQAGRPQSDLPAWGTFEGWSETIQQAVVWLGLPDPSETRVGLNVADEEKGLLQDLLDGLSVIGEEFSPTTVHKLVYEGGQTAEERTRLETLRGALDSGCVQKQKSPTPQSVGKLFAQFRERVSGDLCLRKTSKHGSVWVVEKVVE